MLNFIDYINFAESLLSIGCKCVSITMMCRLLFCANYQKNRLRVKKLSSTMHFYLITHCFLSITGLPYQVYKLVCFLPNIGTQNAASPHSPYVLFWTGIFDLSYSTSGSVPVIFLCLERSLVIIMSGFVTFRVRAILFAFGFLTVFAAWLCSLYGFIVELPLDLKRVSQCMLVGCQVVKQLGAIPLLVKMIFGGIALVLSLIFLLMLSRHGNVANLKNRVVKWTIIAGILFDILPGYSTFIYNKLTGTSLSAYIGDLAVTLCSVDACICSLFYWLILTKKNSVNSASVN